MAAALAACTPGAPPIVSPSPSPSATQRSETPVEREQRVAYEAAEKAYNTALEVLERYLSRGGTDQVPAELSAVATGPYLDTLRFFLQDFKENGDRSTGSGTTTRFVRNGFDPRELLLVACEDGRDFVVLDKSGKVKQRGAVTVSDVTARKIGSSWKVYSATPRKSAECPA